MFEDIPESLVFCSDDWASGMVSATLPRFSANRCVLQQVLTDDKQVK